MDELLLSINNAVGEGIIDQTVGRTLIEQLQAGTPPDIVSAAFVQLTGTNASQFGGNLATPNMPAITGPIISSPAANALPELDSISGLSFGSNIADEFLMGPIRAAQSLAEAEIPQGLSMAGRNAARRDAVNANANEAFSNGNLVEGAVGGLMGAFSAGLGLIDGKITSADEEIAAEFQRNALSTEALPEPEAAPLPSLAESFDLGLGTTETNEDVFEDYIDQVRELGNGLSAPPRLSEEEYRLAGALDILNRGSLRPDARVQDQYALDNAFETGVLDLNLKLAEAEFEYKTDRRSTARTLRHETEVAIKSDRDSFIDGPTGDFHFARVRGDQAGADAAMLSIMAASNEEYFTNLAGQTLNELGVEIDSDVTTFDELVSMLQGNEQAKAVFRRVGVDLDTTKADDPLEIREALTQVMAGSGLMPENMAEVFDGYFPGFSESLGLADPQGYRQFLTPDVFSQTEQLMSFNGGGTPDSLFVKVDGNENLTFNDETMVAAQRLVDLEGKKLPVTSGTRSIAHQRELYEKDIRENGGRPSGKVARPGGSSHNHENAMDVSMASRTPEQKRQFVENALRAGFRGIGFYGPNGHVHIDMGAERTWGIPPAWAKGIDVNGRRF